MKKLSEKKAKLNKDKNARQKTEIRKFRLAWEAIRRNEGYKKLYNQSIDSKKKIDRSLRKRKERRLHKAFRNVKMSGFIPFGGKIHRKFNLIKPVDPSIKADELSDYSLKMAFKGYPVIVGQSSFYQAGTIKGQIVDLNVMVDVTKSTSKICDGFKKIVKSVKNSRRKAETEEKSKKLSRERLFSYAPEDFDVYDKVVKYKKVKGKIPFYKIAREQLEQSGKKNIESYDVDSMAKIIKGAYNRCKWLINGGYRKLM